MNQRDTAPGAALRQRLATLIADRGAAGVQYLVVRGGQTLHEHGVGFADALLARPVTPQTTFNLYSITKTVTAAAVLALAEAGRLDLDAPIGVAAGVAGLEAYGSVRETLLHRAGFRNPNPLRWIHRAEADATFDERAFVQGVVSGLRGSRRALRRSGYSNLGYLLLGLAVERAAEAPFREAVRRLVFEPLCPAAEERLGFAIDRPEQHAPGHLRRRGVLALALGLFVDRSLVVHSRDAQWLRLHLHHVNGSAYGGLIGNARGLARFAQAVIGSADGMSAGVRARLIEIVPGPGPARSLGWFAGRCGRHRWLAHAGGGLGYYGELRLYPDLGGVSVLLTSGPGLVDARCLDRIDPIWLEASP
jgi:CubicO group peptidase (beta-lactamase class C family)